MENLDLTSKEIAEEMGVSDRQVRNYKSIAEEKLGRKLGYREGRNYFYSEADVKAIKAAAASSVIPEVVLEVKPVESSQITVIEAQPSFQMTYKADKTPFTVYDSTGALNETLKQHEAMIISISERSRSYEETLMQQAAMDGATLGVNLAAAKDEAMVKAMDYVMSENAKKRKMIKNIQPQ